MDQALQDLERTLAEVDENASLVGVFIDDTRQEAVLDLANVVRAARALLHELYHG